MKSDFYKKDLYTLASENKTLLSVTIELTTVCNWRCQHCYIPTYTKRGLKREKLNDLFRELREMGTFELIFTGGEIFTRKDVIDIIRDARSYFFDVKLFTNVSLLTESKIEELAKLNVSEVSCTLFSLDEKIHDGITTVKGSLKHSLKNLELLNKYGIKVEVKQILMENNKDCVDEVAQYCAKMGFKHLATTNIFAQSDGNKSPLKLSVDNEYLENNIIHIDKIRNFHCYDRDESTYVCNATRYSCTIEADGTYLACNNLNLPIANINERSIKEIWKRSETLHIIQNKTFDTLENCPQCPLQSYCNRCSGIALLEDGNLWGCLSSERKVANARFHNKEWYSTIQKVKNHC
ncbi:radical SAM/SPASM domain-containing protein [Streptococcus cameli]